MSKVALRLATQALRRIISVQSVSTNFAPLLLKVPQRNISFTKVLQSQSPPGKVTVHFMFPNGKRQTVQAAIGKSLLDVVLDHDVDIDGFGACEATLACSTCHLIFSKVVYEKLPPPCDEELDMLDLAYQLTDTSRLGCQVVLTKELDGMEITVPEGISDARG